MVASLRPRRRPSMNVASTTTTATPIADADRDALDVRDLGVDAALERRELRLDVGLADRLGLGRSGGGVVVMRRVASWPFLRVPSFQVSAADDEQHDRHDRVGRPGPVPGERGAGLLLEQPQPADGDAHDAEAEQQRSGQAERDDPHELLERDQRLLLEVGDDELPELGDDLGQRRRTVGHLSDSTRDRAGVGKRSIAIDAAAATGAGTSSSGVGASGYARDHLGHLLPALRRPSLSEMSPLSSSENCDRLLHVEVARRARRRR